MRWAISTSLLILLLVTILGCGMSYRAAEFSDINDRPDRFQNTRVEVSGVPQIPMSNDFVPPNYFHKGYWAVIVDGQVLMLEREILSIDTERVAAEATAFGARIQRALVERQGE